MESFLFQATVFLLAAVAIVPISARLGFGSALGYIAAGITIDIFAGLASGGHGSQLHNLAEFGVVMMLFVIGLGLEPKAFWGMRHQVVGLGTLQITVTAAIMMAGAMLLGLDWKVSLAAGLILALSSTAIVLQTLTEKGLMGTGGGRASFSVLLMQDISVIPILAALPLLAAWPNYEQTLSGPLQDAAEAAHGVEDAQGEAHHAAEGGGTEALHEAAASYVASLPGWGATLVTIGAVIAVMAAGLYLTRPVFRHISLSRQREVYTAFAILIVAGSALVMEIVGVSPALGAFLAGVVLANSEFRHELTASLRPFKELLLGLFFMTIGRGSISGSVRRVLRHHRPHRRAGGGQGACALRAGMGVRAARARPSALHAVAGAGRGVRLPADRLLDAAARHARQHGRDSAHRDRAVDAGHAASLHRP